MRLGQTAFFPCAVDAVPEGTADVEWTADGRSVNGDRSGGRSTVLPSGALVVRRVRLSDRAEYRCNVTLRRDGGDRVADVRTSRAAQLRIDPGKLVATDLKKKSPVFAIFRP